MSDSQPLSGASGSTAGPPASAAASGAPPHGWLTRTYPALGRPAFARFIFGQTLSNFGTWFQLIAQSLLVLDLGGTGKALGVTAALQFLPMLLLTPHAGVIIDRTQARKVLIVTNAGASVVAFVLWAVTATGHVSIGWIGALAPFFGLSQTFDRPAQGALLGELVAPEHRRSANTLSSVVSSSGRLVGPAMAAVIYNWRGASLCFLLNAVSYAFVVVPLVRIRSDQITPRARKEQLGAFAQLVAGVRYVYRSDALRAPMIWAAVVGLLAFNFFSVFPALIRFEFGQGAGGMGAAEVLNAGASVVGGLWIARRPRRPTRRYLALHSAILSGVLIGVAAMPTFPLFLAWMPVFGVSFITWLTAVTNLIQTETDPAYMGRVMSLFTLGMFGTTPIGSLLTGWIIDHWSARWAMALGVVATVPMALWLAFLRPADAVRRTEAR